MKWSYEQWARRAGRSLILLILAWLGGCASVPEQQTYVLLDRYFSEYETERQAQKPNQLTEIHREAAESERALIERRLDALKKAEEEAPSHISALWTILTECESDLVIDLSKYELIDQVRSMLPEASSDLQRDIVDWSLETSSRVIAAWRQDPNVILFRQAVEASWMELTVAFHQGLKETELMAGRDDFLGAIGKLGEVAPCEPSGTELFETLNAVLEDYAVYMKDRAEIGRYWSLYTVTRQMLELSGHLRQKEEGTEVVGRAAYEKTRQMQEKYWPDIVKHILDVADTHSDLYQQNGLALALCDVVAGLLDEAGSEISPTFRKKIEAAREGYREKAAEALRRTVFVEEIRSPSHKKEAENLRKNIWEKIDHRLQQPSTAVWGVELAPLGDNPEPEENSYVIGGGALEEARSTEQAVDRLSFTRECVYPPETFQAGTIDEGIRQKIVTYHICRTTYHQDARLQGRITIQHAGGKPKPVNWALETEHRWVAEEEEEALRNVDRNPVTESTPAREVITYHPKEENRRQDPDELLNSLASRAAEEVVQRLLEMIKDYPEELDKLAQAAADDEQHDHAAENWALLQEYYAQLLQKNKQAQNAERLSQSLHRTRKEAVSAAERWLTDGEG